MVTNLLNNNKITGKVIFLLKIWVFALVLVGRACHRSPDGGSMSKGKSDPVGSLPGSL